MKFSTPAVSKVVLAVAGLASVVQAGGQHLAARGSDSSKHSQVARKLWKRFSGRGSFYDPNTGNQGACGGFIGTNDWVVALNTDQFAGGAHCNQQVTITANGKTQTATIKDACPGCGYGGLDLTPGLFSDFADHSVGIIQLTWNFGGSSGGGGGGGNNDNNNNDNHDQWTSTSTSSRYTPQWTPSSSSTPRWTPSSSSRRRTSTSSQWTPPAPPSSTWTPSSSSQWSQSTSSWSSSSSRSSSSSSSSSISSSEIANSTMAINSTMTNTTATLTDSTAPAATGSNTALLSPVASNNTNTGSSGALANMAQVVVRMANVVVAAADTA